MTHDSIEALGMALGMLAFGAIVIGMEASQDSANRSMDEMGRWQSAHMKGDDWDYTIHPCDGDPCSMCRKFKENEKFWNV